MIETKITSLITDLKQQQKKKKKSKNRNKAAGDGGKKKKFIGGTLFDSRLRICVVNVSFVNSSELAMYEPATPAFRTFFVESLVTAGNMLG